MMTLIILVSLIVFCEYQYPRETHTYLKKGWELLLMSWKKFKDNL